MPGPLPGPSAQSAERSTLLCLGSYIWPGGDNRVTHGRNSPGVGREGAASQEMRLHPFLAGFGLQEGSDIKNMEKAQPSHCKARTLGSPPLEDAGTVTWTGTRASQKLISASLALTTAPLPPARFWGVCSDFPELPWILGSLPHFSNTEETLISDRAVSPRDNF